MKKGISISLSNKEEENPGTTSQKSELPQLFHPPQEGTHLPATSEEPASPT